MRFKNILLAICLSVLGCSLIFGQATKTTIPQSTEDRYDTQDFGNCTLNYGKDRSRYIQPFVTCISGIDAFTLIPQEDGTWGLVISTGEASKQRHDDGKLTPLDVTIKVGENDPHRLSMVWPENWTMALDSLELTELIPLLDELRKSDLMTISRNDEVIEFDLNRANQVFVELLFEQLVALSRVEKAS